MRYRKLSPTGDYVFGGGQQDFYRDVPEAVGQACKTRLLLWLGEWFLNTESGTPYLQGILGKHSQEEADSTIQTRVRGTQGLVEIQNYSSELDREQRALSAQFDVDTIYGPTAVEVANYGTF